eukprot:scaffold34068_cov21-Attheya_sp.AAC.1
MEAMYFPPKLLTKNETPEVSTKVTFPVKDGYVGFTDDKFKYLNSLITSDLKDKHEIKKRVQKATVQMNELRHLW